MTSILAIDPGPEKSSYCLYDLNKPLKFFTLENTVPWNSLEQLDVGCPDVVVIEKIACYGMPVGASVFDTCIWIGRLIERISFSYYHQGGKYSFMTRQEVKLEICKSSKANDSTIIQALKDVYGDKGTKKNPGILYGIKGDEWQALAVAHAYSEKISRQAQAVAV